MLDSEKKIILSHLSMMCKLGIYITVEKTYIQRYYNGHQSLILISRSSGRCPTDMSSAPCGVIAKTIVVI